jgi:hypothetical protein
MQQRADIIGVIDGETTMGDDLAAANDNVAAPQLAVGSDAAPPPVASIPVVPAGGGGMLGLIERLATNPNFSIEVLNALLKARREEEDREAERAFNQALSAAKGELEPIIKRHDVDFTSKTTGTRTRYKHEQLFDIAQVVDPVFAKHGLAYRFAVRQESKVVAVAPVLSHSGGYSKQMDWLEGDTTVPSGTNMNPFQALSSAITYLQRISLRAAVGLAAGKDDDARSLSADAPPTISVEQANEMEALVAETGRSMVTLLILVGAQTVAEMNVDQFKRAKQVLELARAEQQDRKRHERRAAATDPGNA